VALLFSKRNILVLALLVLPAFLYTTSTPTARAQTANIVAVSPTAIADLSKVSGSVTFELNVTNSAPFNLFAVSVQYGREVLRVHPGGLDFTRTVLGTNILIGAECVDGAALVGNCGPNDNPGVVTLELAIQGPSATPNPTNGELFNVTFDVISTGVSQLHILQALLANNGNLIQTQSFDGYFSNKQCGAAICRPPAADFTITPAVLIRGASATFNASSSHSLNPSGTITSYSWAWGAGSQLLPTVTANPIVQQTYTFAGNFTVILTVNDTFHIQGSTSKLVQVKVSQPPTSHAGEVCLADPGFGSPTTGLCPPGLQAFTGPSHSTAFPGSQLRVAVNLNNSASIINGFDITLKANNTVLQPFDADLSGTILQGPITILVKCIGGKVVQGNTCVQTDTIDTVHFAAVSPILSNTKTGLLFTAIYNIVGNATGPISVGFQTGCGSVQIPTSDPPLCITIVNGGIQAVPETAQAATYSTALGQPFFSIQASPNTFRFTQGTAGAGSSTISLAELLGFSCGGLNCIDLSAIGPSVAGLSTSLIGLSLTDSGTSTLMVSTSKLTPGGSFNIYVVGRPDTVNAPFTGTTYLGSVVVVTVIIIGTPDFSISLNPQTLLIPTGTSASSNVTLTSLNQFSGTGTLTVRVSLTCCSGAPSPTAILTSSSFTLRAAGMFTAALIISASNTAPSGGTSSWSVVVNATSGALTHSATASVLITPPPDKPPIANFTFSPANPIIGQQISFDGSGSHDPDGFVASWQWNFGDGFLGFGEFTSHAFSNSGSFTITLTVTDNGGIMRSTSMPVNVRPQPLDDVSIVSVNVFPTVIVSTQITDVQVVVRNDGLRNETVSVTAFFDSHVIGTVNGVFVQAGNCGFFSCNPVFVNIAWDTTGVAAGNYTISATVFLANDPTPADNTLKDGTVTVLPPPVLTLTPSSGSLGTLVTVHGSGFPNPSQGPFFSPVEIQMTFDDQLLGFFFLQGGSFNFTFDVPHAQAGIVHHVHAIELFPFNLNVQADFLVLSEPGNLSVSVDTGAIYFPGDTAVIYVLTSQGGIPVGPANVQVQITLVLPNGTNVVLAAKSVSTGLFKATFAVPTTGSLGTYGLVVAAHSSAGNGSALAGFEVKPTWLSQHGTTIMGATAIAGVVGFVALAWQKGYLSRRKDQPSSLPF
jgi:hypothetical protein